MGKASRRKHERRTVPNPRAAKPRWAGAPGYDRTWAIAERYASAYDRFTATPKADLRDDARAFYTFKMRQSEACLAGAEHKKDMLQRQLGTLYQALGKEPQDKNDRLVGPGTPQSDPNELLGYARSLATLANDNLQHMRTGTPVVFDPLGVPDATADAAIGLALPFPVVIADFLSTTGMSLPVQAMKNDDGWWVGLIAATIAQGEENGPIDIWPTVTTLHAHRDDDDQAPKELMFGHVRLGGPLPAPPEGLVHVKIDGAEAWVVDIENPEPWAQLWLIAPAVAAVSALRLLDAVNVALIDMPLDRPARRRAAREGAKPALMVDITTGRSTGGGSSDAPTHIDWQHRWTVRGHWKHFGEGTAVARRHPSRVIEVPGHGRCVKVWCPPFIKGPADKPLIFKTRTVAVEPERMPQPSP